MLFDGGIHEGTPHISDTSISGRMVELECFRADNWAHATVILEDTWRRIYRTEPPSALIGLTLLDGQ